MCKRNDYEVIKEIMTDSWHPDINTDEKIREKKFNEWLQEKLANQLESQVEPVACGYCKDCKFWNVENIECTNDVIHINKEAIGFVDDLKTQNWFGCVNFESKPSV